MGLAIETTAHSALATPLSVYREPDTCYELPVYSEHDVARTSEEIAKVACSGVESFIRRAKLEYIGPATRLSTVLALADVVLEEAAEALGAELAKPEWGLAPNNNPSYNRFFRHGLIAQGYRLVAKVPAIYPARPLNDKQGDELCNRRRIYTAAEHKSGYYIYDIWESHCVASPGAEDEHADYGRVTLVDIDPRLYNDSSRGY